MFLRSLTVATMRRWGFRGCVCITRYKPCQRAQNLPNHLNPNVLYRLCVPCMSSAPTTVGQ